jgi:hypothetical protein
MSSHGRMQELLFYATVIEDWERVISYYIQEEDYIKALQVMMKQVSCNTPLL